MTADDTLRTDFLKACLEKLGLQVSQDTTTVPSLSCLHLSSIEPEYTQAIVASLAEVVTKNEHKDILQDNNDIFHIETASKSSGRYEMEDLKNALPDTETTKATGIDDGGIVDYNAVVKRLLIHDELPSSKLTPYFNHHAFFSNLQHYQSLSREAAIDFGRSIIYGEVVTSTNTMLEKYIALSP